MGRTSLRKRINTLSFGLGGGRGPQKPMKQADQHNEIEINFVNRGKIVLQHGPQEVTVGAGDLAIYWAAVPHQVVMTKPPTDITWLVLPLSLFLSWALPSSFRERILAGEILFLSENHADEFGGNRITQWTGEIETGRPDLVHIAELELEVFFRRLALGRNIGRSRMALKHRPRTLQGHQYGKVQQMVRFMTERSHESLTVPQIAKAAGLTPEYAMRIFRDAWGVTIWNFLLQLRVSHAQRLLLSADLRVLDIAHACGFDSLSRFYVAFQRQCKCPPLAYRNNALAKERPPF
jgi:AraC family transcriptional regulator, melibiose operon regulatory protein